MQNNWVKLSTNFFDDEKVKLLLNMPDVGKSIVLVWMRLIIQARKTNDGGLIYLSQDLPYSPKMLASLWGEDESVVSNAFVTLQHFQMINIYENGIISLPNWGKHQSSDKLDIIKEQGKARVAKFRERQKLKALTEGKNSNVTCNVTVTPSNATEIENKNKNKNKEKVKKESASLHLFFNDNSFSETFKDFNELRKKKNAPLTVRATTIILNKLEKYSENNVSRAIEILERSIENGWKGVFPVKDQVPISNKKSPFNLQ